jgi:hypothetical protein
VEKVGYDPTPLDFQSSASTKLASSPYVGRMGFEPIFSTNYLTPVYQTGWISANLIILPNFHSGYKCKSVLIIFLFSFPSVIQKGTKVQGGHVGNRTLSL